MTDKTPRCPLCGGVFIDGTTTFTVELGFGVAVVRDVPARVCEQCGDASLTTEASPAAGGDGRVGACEPSGGSHGVFGYKLRG